jgi:hypothetical protein
LGQIEVKEQVYKRGGRQWRPFSEAAGVACREYSLGLQRAIVDLGSDGAFEKGTQKVKEHYGVEVPLSAVQRITEAHAAKIRQQQVVLKRLPRGGVGQLIGEMDGSFIPIVTIGEREDSSAPEDGRKRRQLSWREARLSLAREPHKLKGWYGATLKGPGRAGELFVDCVIRAGGGKATKLHCVGDGAGWIVNQIKQRLGPLADYLIDFYHLSEYLSGAATAMVGPKQSKDWLRAQQQRMKANEVSAVLHELRAYQPAEKPALGKSPEPASTEELDKDPVAACLRYIENRLDYLDYAGTLKAGLPLGSGEVESGHRSVIQARLKLPGAWWKEETAENMLALRTLRANDQWESYWRELRQAAA